MTDQRSEAVLGIINAIFIIALNFVCILVPNDMLWLKLFQFVLILFGVVLLLLWAFKLHQVSRSLPLQNEE